MNIQTLTLGPLATNCYFVRQDGTAADRLTLAAREAQTLVLHLAGSDMYTAAPKDQILRNTKVYVAQQPKTGDAAQWTLLGTTDKDGALRVSRLVYEPTEQVAKSYAALSQKPRPHRARRRRFARVKPKPAEPKNG